ncbi:hypothetical protein GCM10027020_35570 [Nocardioides salsibiostraticola]
MIASAYPPASTLETHTLRRLVEVMELLHSAPTHDAVLDAVVAGVRDVLGYQMAAIRILQEDQRMLHTAAVVGPTDAVASMHGQDLPLAELALEFSWAERHGDVYFIPHERLPADIVSTWVPDLGMPADPGAWHPMDTLYVAINAPGGRMLGVLGVDLPRNGRRPEPAERELLQMYARQAALALDRTRLLDQQARLVTDLLDRQQETSVLTAALTHDLKGPLTVILSHAELARDELTGPQPHQNTGQVITRLEGIEASVARMTSDIDELLAPRTSTPDDISEDRHDLAEIAEEIATFSRVVAQRRAVTLELQTAGDDFTLPGNRSQLLRAVDNLVGNALKYTPAGGRISVTLHGRDTELVLACADDGAGIPADEQEMVFTEYARAARAQASGIEGTGLGLPNARRIVTAHGGTLTLTSAPELGCTFTIRFPRPERTDPPARHPRN